MEHWTVRPAKTEDMECVETIYSAARHYMATHGNPTQWGQTNPPHELLTEDIARKQLYVAEESGRICGVFAFIIGDDPTYGVIENGAWEGHNVYGAIHRLAGDGSRRGLFAQCVAFCRQQIGELRADTHANNYTMQHLLEQQGFQRRGIIYVSDGSPRIAYQLSC